MDKWLEVTEAQYKTLKLWLRERRLEADFLAADEDEGEGEGEALADDAQWEQPARMPFVECIAAGDILLLAPTEELGQPIHFFYVAVLADWPDQQWLVAPFSQYLAPAVRGEWATDLPYPLLKTLCVWNARNVRHAALRCSWKTHALSPRQLADAREVLRYTTLGEQPSAQVWDRLGAPIIEPYDERICYQDVESRLFSVTLAQLSARAERDNLVYADFRIETAPALVEGTLPMAAADGQRVQVQVYTCDLPPDELISSAPDEWKAAATAETADLPCDIYSEGRLDAPLQFELSTPLPGYRRALLLSRRLGLVLLKGALSSRATVATFDEALPGSRDSVLEGAEDVYLLLCDLSDDDPDIAATRQSEAGGADA